MKSQQEALTFSSFFQYIEDSGLGTYDGLVIQNASDIARESDRVRNQTNWNYQQEKHQKTRRQEGAINRMGFMTMPAPQDRLFPQNLGFTVRSQSLHSVGGGEDDADHNRKQPPPKPKRDPNTKLSSSSELVNGGVTGREHQKNTNNETVELVEVQYPFYSEDNKKMPPPKPKRNPNTQLSTSLDESYIQNLGNRKSSLQWQKSSTQSQNPGSQITDDEEPVYIEMVGNLSREMRGREVVEEEQSESVYEEMKYPMLEDFIMDPEAWFHGSLCDIPPPFPNLLSHRPPLLVFPPAHAQNSPNSDESPLTPLDVTRLPMLENVSYSKSSGAEHPQTSTHLCKEQDPEQDRGISLNHTITTSGRSSAPPLQSNLYKSSGSVHGGHGYPRSQSACPSPVSMGCSLTPVNVKRPPPYDTLMADGTIPHSLSSSSTHNVEEGVSRLTESFNHSSFQNVSMKSRTPTSPLDELNCLFTTGRQMVKRGSGGRRNRELVEYRSLPRHASMDRDGQSSPGSSRMGRSSVSPTLLLSGGGGGDAKSACKFGPSEDSPSPSETPLSHLHEAHQLALSQRLYGGEATMMDMIEKKRVLCGEIKARQRPDKGLCKQDSLPILPSWKRKKHPPPYSAGATGHWDTAI